MVSGQTVTITLFKQLINIQQIYTGGQILKFNNQKYKEKWKDGFDLFHSEDYKYPEQNWIVKTQFFYQIKIKPVKSGWKVKFIVNILKIFKLTELSLSTFCF